MTDQGDSNQIPGYRKQDNLSLLIYLFFFIIFLPIPYIRHIISLSLSILPGGTSGSSEVIGSVAQVVLFALPLIPLSIFWKNERYKLFYRLWLISSCLSIITLPIYLTKSTADYINTSFNIILIGLFTTFLIIIYRKRTVRKYFEIPNQITEESNDVNSTIKQTGFLWLSVLLISILSYYPWLSAGALGSLFDSILQVILSLIIGVLSILLIDRKIFLLTQKTTTHFWRNYFLIGSASAMVLLLIASACSFPNGGIQLLLMITLPGLGWTLSAIHLLFPTNAPLRKTPYIVLISLIASAPLVMIDADELNLLLNSTSGEILSIAIKAAFTSFFAIACVNILFILILRFQRHTTSMIRPERSTSFISTILGIATIVSITFGGLLYFRSGQIGFHGDNIFVILKSQADLSPAKNISNYNERRQFVYQTLVDHANSTQEDIKNQLEGFGIQYKSYYLVNGLLVPNNPILRFWISNRLEIDRILENPQLRPLPEQPSIHVGNEESPNRPQWNLVSIGADRVWEEFGVTGEGIVIGQSDSGVQGDHPELRDSYRGKDGDDNFNWYDPWYHTISPDDIMGHGTHTLGTVVGKNVGVAPGATWIACVNLARNLGNPAYYLDCMQFMLAPFPHDGDPLKDGNPTKGAHVLNNSWGCPDIEGCDPNTFLFAVRALRAAGIFFVAGAGNDGPSCNTLNDPPPIYEETFAVGALDRNGKLAIFSSIGPVTSDGSGRIKPEILAPGVDVLSSLPGDSFGYQSGTSMAGPHVVGVVALIWSANPNLIGNIEGTRQILIQTASPYKGYLPDCPGVKDTPSIAVGFGIVDAYSAVRLALKTIVY